MAKKKPIDRKPPVYAAEMARFEDVAEMTGVTKGDVEAFTQDLRERDVRIIGRKMTAAMRDAHVHMAELPPELIRGAVIAVGAMLGSKNDKSRRAGVLGLTQLMRYNMDRFALARKIEFPEEQKPPEVHVDTKLEVVVRFAQPAPAAAPAPEDHAPDRAGRE